MKAKYIEGLLKHLLTEYAKGDQDGVPEESRITEVVAFDEAGYDKPCGIRIECADGSRVFVQFLGTAANRGAYPEEPHYYLTPDKVGTERYIPYGKH